MAANLESVVKQLADSGIIAPGKLENFIPPKADPRSVEELVQALVQSENLTAFQGQQVKAGKAKALILGNYTLLDKIGAGGMGQVFKAQHRKMKRLVAIKMLPPGMTKDAAALARFEREVEAAAKLSHPNIVAAHDADEANGAHFLVMEYVEGKDLSATVKQDGPLPVNKAVNYVLQAARGLEFAHSEGVVHRDIKPANLLLDRKGVVKILDMGLARIEQAGGGEQAELTGTGTIMGTVDYMSPEQAVSTKNADHRADIYSLGMSLYYLLAGKAAYSGESAMEKLMAHQTQPIPSLQDVQTTVPKQLDAVFKKMAAKRIEDRYQSMSEVVEALEGLGYGGSGTLKRGEVASTIDLSSADRQKLSTQAKKKPLGSITEVVASEKSKNLVLKIVGGSFGTIIAPILVYYLIHHLEKRNEPPNPPAATVAATSTPLPSGEGFGASAQPSGGRRPPSSRAQAEGGEGGPAPSANSIAASTVPHPPLGALAAPSPDGRRVDVEPPPAKAPFDAKQAKAYQAAWARQLNTQVETINSVGMRMTLIPPGEFLMGSTPEQVAWGRKMGEDDKISPTDYYFQRLPEEVPQHKVTITQPLLIGTTEVTVAQFRKFVEATKYETEAEKYGLGNSGDKTIDKAKEADKGKNWKSPGYAITDGTPVTQITWNDAVAYCAWVSEQEQRRPWYRPDGKGGWLFAAHADGYRLPTEAEWEYACRAGTTTQYSFGDDKTQLEQYGWFKENAGSMAQPVALKRPNPFGLFDIHGNAYEWCQDWNDKKWYEKSSPGDPTGPSSGSNRVIRGGGWNHFAANCRSACRHGNTPSGRYGYLGFRIVRVADTTADSRIATATATTQPNQPWNTPAFQAWVKATQALPAEQQIEAVSEKLMELNPGFDGELSNSGGGKPKLENGAVRGIGLVTDHVTDISPLRAWSRLTKVRLNGSAEGKGRLSDLAPLAGMQLTQLTCQFAPVSDLSPLSGMKITDLYLDSTEISELAPLRNLPLTTLSASETHISNLEPLRGMELSDLKIGRTEVADLSPLRGMPLRSLQCNSTPVSDLSPLEGNSSLIRLTLFGSDATSAGVARLQESLPNCKIEWPNKGEFYARPASTKKLAYLDPAFQAWVKATQALPAEQQIEAVSKKLMELNPGFDGKVTNIVGDGPPTIYRGVVTSLEIIADNVTDISPVRALAGLKSLRCLGSGSDKAPLSDLSPLEGMQLTTLSCTSTHVVDLSPLRAMPLTMFSCRGSPVSDLSPLKGMPLAELLCFDTKISDLSPLAGMNLALVRFTPKSVATGVDALRQMKSLNTIGIGYGGDNNFPPAEFWKKYDAGEFGRPAPSPQPSPPRPELGTKAAGGEGAKKKLAYLDPAFQQWVKVTQALPAEQQIEAVSKKLMELNSGFKGTLHHPNVENGMVTQAWVIGASVTDLSPLRVFAGLKMVKCGGTSTEQCTLTDLSPLSGMGLQTLWCNSTQVSDLSPLQGMNLVTLSCYGTPISDLSPLQGMGLSTLICFDTRVADLKPLEQMNSLRVLKVSRTNITAASVAALQKALPNCKIDWDAVPSASPAGEGARPKTLEPAASGSK